MGASVACLGYKVAKYSFGLVAYKFVNNPLRPIIYHVTKMDYVLIMLMFTVLKGLGPGAFYVISSGHWSESHTHRCHIHVRTPLQT